MSQDKPVGPASGSPDVAALANGLQEWASYYFGGILPNVPTGSLPVTLNEAAQTLRALEAQVEQKHQQTCDWMDVANKETGRNHALQHEADRLRGWLGEALDQWWYWMTIPFAERSIVNAHAAQERIAQIRKEAF